MPTEAKKIKKKKKPHGNSIDPAKVRRIIVALKVTKDERKKIASVCDYHGLDISNWLRTLILANIIQKGKPLPVLPVLDLPVVEEIPL